MHKVRVLCGAAMLTGCLAPAAHADQWTKLTYFTFSAPVELPGIALPAGTYRFELADPEDGRRAVRVSDKEGGKVRGTFLSLPNERLEPAGKPLVMFKESPAGAPEAVKAWFYPGESTGYEFVYPHDQALKIAKSTHSPVLTADGEVNGTTTAATTRTAAAQPTTAPAIEPPATVAPQPVTTPRGATLTEPAPVGTSGEAPRRNLPRTASLLPLIGLCSGVSIGGGLAFRALRRAIA